MLIRNGRDYPKDPYSLYAPFEGKLKRGKKGNEEKASANLEQRMDMGRLRQRIRENEREDKGRKGGKQEASNWQKEKNEKGRRGEGKGGRKTNNE